MAEPVKHCRICDEDKTIDEFPPNGGRICRECRRISQRKENINREHLETPTPWDPDLELKRRAEHMLQRFPESAHIKARLT